MTSKRNKKRFYFDSKYQSSENNRFIEHRTLNRIIKKKENKIQNLEGEWR